MSAKLEVRPNYHYAIRVHQVLAVEFICSIIIFILMSICLISSYWITTDGFRQGLLYLCIDEPDYQNKNRYVPLPFDLSKEELAPGCYPNRDVGYLKLCTFLCLMTQLSSVATACLTGLGVQLKGLSRIRCVKLAICTTLVIIICDLSLIAIYPYQFGEEIERSNRNLWELNYAFGLACGSAILGTGALILLVVAYNHITNAFESPPTMI